MNLSDKARELRVKLSGILPLLNERQRRVLAATEAKSYGRGGVTVVSKITGISRQTIYKGLEEIGDNSAPDRVRRKGGGRKRLVEKSPKIVDVLEELIEPSKRGDPESPLKWTCKSVRILSQELIKKGINVSPKSVANILHELDYSLQANRKTSEGKADHPDRDDQFKFINKKAKYFLKRELPIISVDTKKKELIGNYKNEGKEWRKKRNPIDVLSHDFPDPENPKAVPYGVYDIANNTGWVNVGVSADTAEFAVESIRQWWITMGKKKYSSSRKIFICADSGGSNGYRIHLWKYELQKFCDKYKLEVSVSHYPPGTSKWNKIEHKLFSFITLNWRGRPLTDYRTVVELIAKTTTKAGLSVKARLDKKEYKKGIKVPKSEMSKLNIKRDKFHGEWNYIIKPRNV